jgi:putative transposase
MYGASASKETVSRITEKVMEAMTEWANRPLDGVYVAVFIDAIMVRSAMARLPTGCRRSLGTCGC